MHGVLPVIVRGRGTCSGTSMVSVLTGMRGHLRSCVLPSCRFCVLLLLYCTYTLRCRALVFGKRLHNFLVSFVPCCIIVITHTQGDGVCLVVYDL